MTDYSETNQKLICKYVNPQGRIRVIVYCMHAECRVIRETRSETNQRT